MQLSLETLIPISTTLVILTERLSGERRARTPGSERAYPVFELFLGCSLALVAGGIAEYLYTGKELAGLWWAAGVTLAVAGLLIRRRAISALGNAGTGHREAHVTTVGPFSWCRHPAYFAVILELLGTAMILRSWWSLLAAGVVFVPALILRLRSEEALLAEKYGPAYQDYRRATPLIFPWRGRLT